MRRRGGKELLTLQDAMEARAAIARATAAIEKEG
jgi:hypothetical protein